MRILLVAQSLLLVAATASALPFESRSPDILELQVVKPRGPTSPDKLKAHPLPEARQHSNDVSRRAKPPRLPDVMSEDLAWIIVGMNQYQNEKKLARYATADAYNEAIRYAIEKSEEKGFKGPLEGWSKAMEEYDKLGRQGPNKQYRFPSNALVKMAQDRLGQGAASEKVAEAMVLLIKGADDYRKEKLPDMKTDIRTSMRTDKATWSSAMDFAEETAKSKGQSFTAEEWAAARKRVRGNTKEPFQLPSPQDPELKKIITEMSEGKETAQVVADNKQELTALEMAASAQEWGGQLLDFDEQFGDDED